MEYSLIRFQWAKFVIYCMILHACTKIMMMNEIKSAQQIKTKKG